MIVFKTTEFLLYKVYKRDNNEYQFYGQKEMRTSAGEERVLLVELGVQSKTPVPAAILLAESMCRKLTIFALQF